jgi:TRAP-type C4-dicarboxylate transport system substrate-binding protein
MRHLVTSPTQIRMGGYGPPTTAFSKSLKFIGDRLESEFGDAVDIEYIWNILDLGYRGEDIFFLVESGILTLGYQSSSYLTDRVPELGVVDLPFLFEDHAQARAAIDGPLGELLATKIESRTGFRVLGFFENGFRHVSNRLRPVRHPDDLAGMTIRVMPSDVHARTFDLLGATAIKMDLSEAIRAIVEGRVDAQENPLANTVTYGAHTVHPHHTLTGHFYVSRPILAHAESLDGWPEPLREALQEATREAVALQRRLSEREAVNARRTIEEAGGEIVALSPEERAAFQAAVEPMRDDAGRKFTAELLELLPE